MSRTMLLGLLLLLAPACGDDDDDTADGDADADSDADGDADADADEPRLGATCTADPDDCPAGLSCFLELGCVVEECPSAGPGAEHGCPTNGFCYTVDQSETGYCARVCEETADCTAVNPALVCEERTSTAPTKICVLAK